jgi:asparagine synthase (glutamine-hydrolysing)
MPGIAGLITKMPREWAEPQLQRMVKSMCHESFYNAGTWIDESRGIYVGWTVRKNSFSDGMPLQNERGDVTLIFSGEEFPEPGIAQRLKERGHSVEGKGPNYLVHVYEEDSAFPKSLNGRFHGLLADRTKGTATLFVDRYGMHRLYYHEAKEAFYFAAEAKAILTVRPELREFDPAGLGDFITCGCTLENRSLFKGIRVLPPSSAWSFRNGSIERKDAFFDPKEWENQESLDHEAYYQELRTVFSRNIPRYVETQERIGLSTTGGLDTRMIMSWWKAQPGTVPCYTFRGMYNDCQDVIVARKITEAWQQPHQEIEVGKDFLSRFPHYAERSVYLTDGCVEVIRSPVLYTNEIVSREIAPVRMTGNYGSEVLRRMVAFRDYDPPKGLFSPALRPHVLEAKATYARLRKGNPASFIAFAQAPYHHYGLAALEESQLSPRSPFLDNDVVRTAFRAPDSSLVRGDLVADHDDALRLIADGNPALARIRSDRGIGGTGGVLGSLTRAYFEVTFRAEYEFDYGMRPSVAKVDHLLSPLHMDRLFLGRHKYYHFRVWYRDELSKYVQEMLLDPRTLSRPFFQKDTIQAMVDGHVKKGENHTGSIHKALSVELISRLFLDSGSSAAPNDSVELSNAVA